MTLAELLVVIAIMGVLAALAAPRFAASTQRNRFQSTALRIQADVALARESARTTSSSRTLRFSAASDSYQLLGSDALNGGRAGSVLLAAPPYQAELTLVDFDGGTDLIFDGYGRITTGGELRLKVGDLRARLVFTADETTDDPPPDADGQTDGGGLLSPILGVLGL